MDVNNKQSRPHAFGQWGPRKTSIDKLNYFILTYGKKWMDPQVALNTYVVYTNTSKQL